jgi:hypothetical protein
LLWVGKERTVEAFQGFFTMLGEELTSKIQFVCSDTHFISGAHYRRLAVHCVGRQSAASSSQPKNIPDSMNYMGKMVERDFTGLAEAVPEDNWRFKPTEGAFTERC